MNGDKEVYVVQVRAGEDRDPAGPVVQHGQVAKMTNKEVHEILLERTDLQETRKTFQGMSVDIYSDELLTTEQKAQAKAEGKPVFSQNVTSVKLPAIEIVKSHLGTKESELVMLSKKSGEK